MPTDTTDEKIMHVYKKTASAQRKQVSVAAGNEVFYNIL